MEYDEPFGSLPGELGPQPPDELLDPRVAGAVLPVQPPSSAHRIPSRYRHSAGASMIAAGLIGLRDVIDPALSDDGTVIEQPAQPRVAPEAMEVYLDPDDPAASMVVIRDPNDLN